MPVERLSLSPEELSAGVSIIKQFSADETYPEHCHDFGELFFISRGKGIHCISGQNQLLEKGTLVLIRPDDVHGFQPINHFDLTMYSIGFPVSELQRAADYLGTALSDLPMPLQQVLHGYEFLHMEQQMEALLRATEAERLLLFRTMLPSAMLRLLQGRTQGESTEVFMPPWLARLARDMRQRENFVAGLPRLLAMCPYSQEYVGRMFRQHLKTTPTGYINALRMEYAVTLLQSQDMSVTEICYACGFNNLSHFYATFRRMYGCSPGEMLHR